MSSTSLIIDTFTVLLNVGTFQKLFQFIQILIILNPLI
jgi:hypothetical protein